MRQQLNLHKCVGITKAGELIMVDYIFNDEMNGQPFHGATGSRFMPIDQAYIDERNDVDHVTEIYGYLWSEAVAEERTTDSLEDYMQALIDSEVRYGNGLFLGHDDSSVHHIPEDLKKMHYDGYETFECVGGGRMFPLKEEMLLILDQDLWDAVQAIEADPLDLEMIQDLVGGELIEKNKAA